jgi:hypothetical protein
MKASTQLLSSYYYSIFVLILAFANLAEARIGETSSAIDARIVHSGGIQYRDEALKNNRQQGMWYPGFLHLMRNYDLKIYFKSADGSKPKSSDMSPRRMSSGWDLHVIYIGGRSVFEAYRRSAAMTDFEFNQILKMQAGNSYWKKIGRPEEGSEFLSIFGCNLERADGAVRAMRRGNDLIFIDSDLDTALAKKRLENQKNLAPRSVMGF